MTENTMKRKLGIFIWFGYRLPVQERIHLIREVGFETVLHWWDDSFIDVDGLSKEEQADAIRNAGLGIENAHLQDKYINDLWMDSVDGQAAFDKYLSDIDALAQSEIPVAVMHVTSGPTPPPLSAIGMKRMQAIIERAQDVNVKIALENVRNPHILKDIFDSMNSPALGFCYDSGHDYIWSQSPHEILKRYREKLFAVHLHDNKGLADDHLPAGKGIVNWETVLAEISKSSYKGSLTLESNSAKIPESRTPYEHLKIHFEAAKAYFLMNS
jgi:Sugar phosphate isomerases/epimerases